MAGIVRNASGVTLIELLVVVAIMMTVLSLVGGTTLRSVNKVKGQTELISLLNIMKQASAKAFPRAQRLLSNFLAMQFPFRILPHHAPQGRLNTCPLKSGKLFLIEMALRISLVFRYCSTESVRRSI